MSRARASVTHCARSGPSAVPELSGAPGTVRQDCRSCEPRMARWRSSSLAAWSWSSCSGRKIIAMTSAKSSGSRASSSSTCCQRRLNFDPLAASEN